MTLAKAIASTFVLLSLVGIGSVCATDRSRQVVDQFKREQPCPATHKSRGPCPGWQIDHIEPLCAGGADRVDNLQWLSVDAHRAKTRKDVAACFGRVYRPPKKND